MQECYNLHKGNETNERHSTTRVVPDTLQLRVKYTGRVYKLQAGFLQAARKLAQCTHRTRLKAAFKKALEKLTLPATLHATRRLFERFRFSVSSRTPKKGTTSRLTGVGSLLPPVYSEAWAKDWLPYVIRKPRESLSTFDLFSLSSIHGLGSRTSVAGLSPDAL
ncbi:hypothetical protein TNCV_4283071 [Trichonephila clavipes]|nr:hypothetical protein TNCV_4283071 [Trichonephila clavipes]